MRYAEKTTSSKANDGICQRELGRASVPAAVRLFHNSTMLPVMSISLTGCVILPLLKANPSMPNEKSPVTGLQFPPLKPVTSTPLPVSFNISSKDTAFSADSKSLLFINGIRHGRETSSLVGYMPILPD